MDLSQIVLKSGVLAVLLLGASFDLRTRRIPNSLTFGSALLGLITNAIVFGGPGAVTSLEGWAIGVVLLAIPFAMRATGGGDVKLLAAVGAWVGPHYTFATFAYAAVVGGLIALILLIRRGQLLPLIQCLARQAQVVLLSLLGSIGLAIVPLLPIWPSLHGTSGTSRTYVSSRFAFGPALLIGGILALLVA
ncbi:MAG TPA: A24 family peptidase [Chloroflexota bacterium]|nr:A24 family peptidase [Chloroflexota bacterium]